MDTNTEKEENCDKRLYIGNIDHRISEATLLKLFSPYGKIESEDFVCHTRGAKRGEPRGYAFIQYSSIEEASEAKEKMNGRMACGRPLVVRLASEKSQPENKAKMVSSSHGTTALSGSNSGQTSRSAKITAIKNKLRRLDQEDSHGKKQKKDQNT